MSVNNYVGATCGACGHEGDLEDFSATPVSGQLPLDVIQCPACGVAVRKRSPAEKVTHVYPSGGAVRHYPEHPHAIEGPGEESRLVYVESRL